MRRKDFPWLPWWASLQVCLREHSWQCGHRSIITNLTGLWLQLTTSLEPDSPPAQPGLAVSSSLNHHLARTWTLALFVLHLFLSWLYQKYLHRSIRRQGGEGVILWYLRRLNRDSHAETPANCNPTPGNELTQDNSVWAARQHCGVSVLCKLSLMEN